MIFGFWKFWNYILNQNSQFWGGLFYKTFWFEASLYISFWFFRTLGGIFWVQFLVFENFEILFWIKIPTFSTNTELYSRLLSLHASPPLHGFLDFKRKPCLIIKSPIYRSYLDCKFRAFIMVMLSPCSLLFPITGIWRWTDQCQYSLRLVVYTFWVL